MGKKHGYRYHPLYATWCNMKSRCNNHNHPQYKDYGGRGIGYCLTWECFPSFLRDVGEKPFPEASLDRIDNDGDYTSKNVRWADRRTQRINSRQVRFVEINGQRKLITDWCKEYKISIASVHRRLKKGEDIVNAITRPKQARFQ